MTDDPMSRLSRYYTLLGLAVVGVIVLVLLAPFVLDVIGVF